MTSYGVFLVVINIIVGVTIALVSTNYSKKQLVKSKENFFTAGRSVNTAFMIASFIAYAVGTGLLFSPGESAYTTGLTAMIGYALAISLAYIVFVPISGRIRTLIPQGHTIGEYAKTRYGSVMYVVTLFTTTIYMFLLFATNMTGATLAFNYVGGIPRIISVLIIGIPTMYFAMRGGVIAAIFSSGLQSILITPFLIVPVIFVLTHFHGAAPVFADIMRTQPEFLEIGNSGGVQFAIMIIIAVCAAELMNQTLWQRIYSASSNKIVKRSLVAAAVMVFPMTIIASFLGLAAVAMKLDVPHTSVVAALVVNETVPRWANTLFILVIMLAATSTGGDALSGFSSLFSIDIVKSISPNLDEKKAVRVARIGAIIMGLAGMTIAYFQPSVLFLLLLADLFASATVFPIIGGLYLPKVSGIMAAIATIAGIIAGLPMFIAGNSLFSFLLALVVSTLITILANAFGTKKFDYDKLKTEITNLQKGGED